MSDHSSISSDARAEWRAAWPLPFIGMLGLCGAAMLSYASGVFMQPITAAFGWSRAEFSFGLTLAMLIGLVTTPLAGRLVDRFGPRAVALAGCASYPLAFALLGTVNGDLWSWYGCAALLAVLTPALGPMVWTTAVVGRFAAGRGMALGVTLAGVPLSAAVWPATSNLFLGELGWRLAFPALAASWALVAVPLIVLFFRPVRAARAGGGGGGGEAAPVAGAKFREAVFSRRFVSLAAAGGLFSLVVLGATVHMAPILADGGLDRTHAANITAIIGLAGIAGRVGTGLLIDRLPPRRIGVIVFLLPVVSCLLLRQPEISPGAAMLAAALMGLATGAELDIITYLAARYFGLRSFGAIMGLMNSVFAVLAGFGPLIAGLAFDQSGDYRAFLLAATPLFGLSALLIWSLPSPDAPRPAAAEPAFSAPGRRRA